MQCLLLEDKTGDLLAVWLILQGFWTSLLTSSEILHGDTGALHAETLMLHFLHLYQASMLGEIMLISVALAMSVTVPGLTDSVSLCVAAC